MGVRPVSVKSIFSLSSGIVLGWSKWLKNKTFCLLAHFRIWAYREGGELEVGPMVKKTRIRAERIRSELAQNL